MKKINRRAQRVISTRENLVILLFVASGITIGFILNALSGPDNQAAGARIFVALCILAAAVTTGWLRYRWLGKKLNELVKQKNADCSATHRLRISTPENSTKLLSGFFYLLSLII